MAARVFCKIVVFVFEVTKLGTGKVGHDVASRELVGENVMDPGVMNCAQQKSKANNIRLAFELRNQFEERELL